MNHNEEVPDFLGGLGDMLPADVLKKVNELLEYIEEKGIAVDPERVFPLEEVAQAHAFLQSQDSFGKVIVLDPSAVGEQASE